VRTADEESDEMSKGKTTYRAAVPSQGSCGAVRYGVYVPLKHDASDIKSDALTVFITLSLYTLSLYLSPLSHYKSATCIYTAVPNCCSGGTAGIESDESRRT